MRKVLLLLLAATAIVYILIFVPFGKPDFVGYVYQVAEVTDQTIIIGEDKGDGMNVLISPGATSISVGSKVKVYYKVDSIKERFPTSEKARLLPAKQNKEEKKAIQTLFRHISTQYERNFYPEIVTITSKDQEWVIVVNELNMDDTDRHQQTHTYIIYKKDDQISQLE
ncbi:MAG TPA: hypothetical protein IAA29_17085 [Candidatus Paenibacillus intestinavium]|nr:hypothetical protein [Candidatus Paenibacillus intestinavium]